MLNFALLAQIAGSVLPAGKTGQEFALRFGGEGQVHGGAGFVGNGVKFEVLLNEGPDKGFGRGAPVVVRGSPSIAGGRSGTTRNRSGKKAPGT